MKLNHSTLHYFILDHVIKNGYAPSIDVLAKAFDKSSHQIKQALLDLQDYHGVVLHPKSCEVWVIHPFSLAPSNFLLIKSAMEWWSSCAWCSFGAASLLGGDVDIITTLGANQRQVKLHIRNNELSEDGYFVHFPIPMINAWDNVIYSCSTMLLFDNENAIEHWSLRHNIPKGDVQQAQHIFEFAKAWYGRHLEQNWKKWTLEEARQIFNQFELKHNVWDLPKTEKTF